MDLQDEAKHHAMKIE